MYEGSDDAYGALTGLPRRELGIISYSRGAQVAGASTVGGTRSAAAGGAVPLQVVIPRVRKDGAAAQFYPASAEQTIASAYQRHETGHMFTLSGAAHVHAAGSVSLFHDEPGHARAKVFEATKAQQGEWVLRYRFPLSCHQVRLVPPVARLPGRHGA